MTKVDLRRFGFVLGRNDWSFARSSALFSLGNAIAGLLGYTFSAYVAQNYPQSEFGALQYAIAVASILSLGVQPLGQHVLTRFVAKYHDDPLQLDEFLGVFWILYLAVVFVSIVVGVAVLKILNVQNVLPIVVVFAGVSVLYVYWGLASGNHAPNWFSLAYVMGNLFQLILAMLITRSYSNLTSTPLIYLYGLCFLLPPIVTYLLGPKFAVGAFRSATNYSAMLNLLRFSVPIWLSHGSYVVFQGLDVLLLGNSWGKETVATYVAFKTLANVSMYFPTGIATVLMPKTASSEKRGHHRMLLTALLATLIASSVVLGGYLVLGKWIVSLLFGSLYQMGDSEVLIMAAAMALQACNNVIVASLVGRGKPGIEALGRMLAVIGAATVGVVWVPTHGVLGAVSAMMTGASIMFSVYCVHLVRAFLYEKDLEKRNI